MDSLRKQYFMRLIFRNECKGLEVNSGINEMKSITVNFKSFFIALRKLFFQDFQKYKLSSKKIKAMTKYARSVDDNAGKELKDNGIIGYTQEVLKKRISKLGGVTNDRLD